MMSFCGTTMHVWMRLWELSHAISQGSVARIAWPDGRSTLEQMAYVVEMFGIISSAFYRHAETELDRR